MHGPSVTERTALEKTFRRALTERPALAASGAIGRACEASRAASTRSSQTATSQRPVTIKPSDRGFETNGCGTWTSDLRRITKSRTRFGAGTYLVGVDIAPGTYVAKAGSSCYWERLRAFTGDLNAIIANANPRGRTIVTFALRQRVLVGWLWHLGALTER